MVQSAAIAADSIPLSAFFQGRFNSNLFYAIHHFFLVCHLASHLDPFHLACRTSDQQAFYTSYASPIGNYRQLNAAAKKKHWKSVDQMKRAKEMHLLPPYHLLPYTTTILLEERNFLLPTDRKHGLYCFIFIRSFCLLNNFGSSIVKIWKRKS